MTEKVNVDANDDIDVRDRPAAHRFEVWVGDERAGFTHYVDRGDGVVAFDHTEIQPRFEHRGLAGRLIGEALADLPQDKPAVLYCKTGQRSAETLAVLKGAGFSDAVHVGGGVIAWANQIDPRLPTY